VADWAVSVFGMVPFIKLCLGTMLPMLGMAKQDNMRWVFATGHHHLFDVILFPIIFRCTTETSELTVLCSYWLLTIIAVL